MQRLAVLLVVLAAAIWIAAPGSGAFAGPGAVAHGQSEDHTDAGGAAQMDRCATCPGHDEHAMDGACAACQLCAPILAAPGSVAAAFGAVAIVAPPVGPGLRPAHAPGTTPPPPRL